MLPSPVSVARPFASFRVFSGPLPEFTKGNRVRRPRSTSFTSRVSGGSDKAGQASRLFMDNGRRDTYATLLPPAAPPFASFCVFSGPVPSSLFFRTIKT